MFHIVFLRGSQILYVIKMVTHKKLKHESELKNANAKTTRLNWFRTKPNQKRAVQKRKDRKK